MPALTPSAGPSPRDSDRPDSGLLNAFQVGPVLLAAAVLHLNAGADERVDRIQEQRHGR